MNKKVLFFIDSLGSGGAQRQMVTMAKAFIKLNIEVDFLTYYKYDFFGNELKGLGIKNNTIVEPSYFKRILKVRKFIRQGEYDVVISFLSGPSFMSELATLPYKSWKLIVGERSANPIMMRSWKFIMFRFFHLLSDKVVTNSIENKKMVAKTNPLLSNSKLHCVYNSIDLDYWCVSEDYKFVEDSKFKLVVPASHHELKNLKGLIEAIKILPKAYRDKLKVCWYGKELDESKIKGMKKIEEYGLQANFEFFKPTNNIKTIIQTADAVGLFSHYEGLSNSICEGMACGKPIIATKVSDNSILLKNSPELLCNPKDYVSIKESLVYLLDCKKKKLINIGKKNRVFAEEHFEIKKNIQLYLNLIKENE